MVNKQWDIYVLWVTVLAGEGSRDRRDNSGRQTEAIVFGYVFISFLKDETDIRTFPVVWDRRFIKRLSKKNELMN